MTTSRPVRDGAITANGVRLHYREWSGSRATPVIVLLHGLGLHAHSWNTVAAALQADGHHVIAIDQRGHGESGWAPDYAWEGWPDDVVAVVRTLRLPRITLVGHSLGGWLAYHYAALHPNVVHKLVVVDAGPPKEPNATWSSTPDAMPEVVVPDITMVLEQRRALLPRVSEEDLCTLVLHNWRQGADGRWVLRTDPRLNPAYQPIVRPEYEQDWQAWCSVRCPTLLVRGAEGLDRDLVQQMVASLPSCHLTEVSESGHLVHLENPLGFLRALRPFLGSGN